MYSATCVTRTTSLRQESYRGVTQWLVTGFPSNTKVILKFFDEDWTGEQRVSAPLSASKDQARKLPAQTRSTRVTLMRRMSFWKKLEA